MAYMRPTGWPEKFTSHFRLLYNFLLNKWYFDELYNVLFVKPAFSLGRFFWKRGDEGTIDRFGPNGAASIVVFGGKYTRRLARKGVGTGKSGTVRVDHGGRRIIKKNETKINKK